MDLEADLDGIYALMRNHIDIRNHSRFKIIYKNCFVASKAIRFLINQGLADSREQACLIVQKMIDKGLLCHYKDTFDMPSSSKKKFYDGSELYQCFDDQGPQAAISTTAAGNGTGIHVGKLGCKFSFAPHTSHNSPILDLSLAEEIEKGVAQGDMVTRKVTFEKLRSRVREAITQGSTGWDLTQSISVNDTPMNVYRRDRPWGALNTRMTGRLAESPIRFIESILSFQQRAKVEANFEDGVAVESIDLQGEEKCFVGFDEPALAEWIYKSIQEAEKDRGGQGSSSNSSGPDSCSSPRSEIGAGTREQDHTISSFLSTVELAGIPDGMSIGYLNDPSRQLALSHLRKAMMASLPDECMLCTLSFQSPGDIRFCPNCAMICCSACVGRRVFEITSKKVVSVCLHCYGSSKRIRHPPSDIKNKKMSAKLGNQWWNQEDLQNLMTDAKVNPTSKGTSRPSGEEEDLESMKSHNKPIGTLGALAEAFGDFDITSKLADAIGMYYDLLKCCFELSIGLCRIDSWCSSHIKYDVSSSNS